MITVDTYSNTNQSECTNVSIITQSRVKKHNQSDNQKTSRGIKTSEKLTKSIKNKFSVEKSCGDSPSRTGCCGFLKTCKCGFLNEDVNDSLLNTMVINDPRSSPEPLVTNGQIDRRRVCINISGKRYETLESTLAKYPETLLAIPQRELFFDSLNGEYFFDRNRKAFGAILTYCQTGVLVKPPTLEERIFAAELRFFGFEAESLAHNPANPIEKDIPLPANETLKKIWQLFEIPDSSFFAKAVSLLSMTVILTSIVMFCLETVPAFKEPRFSETKLGNGTTERKKSGFRTKKYYKPVFDITEATCIAWFTLEYLLRFISSPKKFQFLHQPLNMIDLIAIVPFYITQILSQASSTANMESLSILRILRLVRVFRIFKLSRYSKGLKILGYTFRASLQELGLLAFFLLIGIILFASAAYYCEEHVEDTKFTSIIESFWWAIVTMTTVGYGDMYPKTPMGKVVGSLCVLVGVLAIAFPVPVIVNNFTYYYTLEQGPPEPLDDEYLETPLGNNRNSYISTTSESSNIGDEFKDISDINRNNTRKRKQATTGENGMVGVKPQDVNAIHFDDESPV